MNGEHTKSVESRTEEQKLRRYEVIRRDTCEELAAAVSSYLNAGWELTGGVHVANDVNGSIRDCDGQIGTVWLWMQAIWRYEP